LRNNTRANYRGPASLGGTTQNRWIENGDLDPILNDYTRITLDRFGFAMPFGSQEGVVNYRTPDHIVNPIAEAYVVNYQRPPDMPNPASPSAFNPPQPVATRPAGANPPSDVLYCFEGATGVDGRGGGAWSLMGYALARHDNAQRANPFDVYIVFRGS